MKLLLPLICILCCLSLTGHAETLPATTGALSDAAKGAVQGAITAAKKDLSEKNAALTAALKAKTDAVAARDKGAEKIKTLEETATKSTDAAAKTAAQQALPAEALSQLAFQKLVEEKTLAADAAQNAQIAAENTLNGLLGTGSANPQQQQQAAGGAPATQNPLTLGNDKIYQASLAALTKFFVVAVLLESGLALVFNSALFLALFNRRTTKPLFTFVIAFLLVWIFDLDLLAQLIAAYNAPPAPGGPVPEDPAGIVSMVISALILAGGSAGVFNIMVSLGFRSEPEGDTAPPLPGAEQAWVSVRLTNFTATADNVKINIQKVEAPANNPPMATAGTILARPKGLRQLLRPIKGRFPPVAGYTVEANEFYKIEVMVKTANGERNLMSGTGIYKFAPRAIVDLEVPYTPA